jgi:hypothetical protein
MIGVFAQCRSHLCKLQHETGTDDEGSHRNALS